MLEMFNIVFCEEFFYLFFVLTLDYVLVSVTGTSTVVSLLLCRVCGCRCTHIWHPSFYQEHLEVFLFSQDLIFF
jgi:hypothetical protein